MRYIISLILASAALPATAEVPRVVADLPPVHSLVAQVMGTLGQPTLLLDKGANAHAFQMRPSQAAGLQAANLVVWIGPEMTPWLDRALEGINPGAQLRLLAADGTYRQDFAAEPGHDHEADDHDAATQTNDQDGHDEAEHDHAHEGLDPHAWLDPGNASHWLGVIANKLSALDPANAATYAANAAQAQADLATLDSEIAATLAPARAIPLVVYHNAYGYFAGHYGLTIAAAVSEGDASAPGAQHIAEIEALLALGPACLLPEQNHDPKLVQQLAEASGLTVAGALDPSGSQLDPGPALYGQMMRGMADTIADCAD